MGHLAQTGCLAHASPSKSILLDTARALMGHVNVRNWKAGFLWELSGPNCTSKQILSLQLLVCLNSRLPSSQEVENGEACYYCELFVAW